MIDQGIIENRETYQDLIKEAFVYPIRNVTIIDDEYPTFNGFLEHQLNATRVESEKISELKENQLKPVNITRLKSIMNMFSRTHKWSVDVYDGQAPRFGAILDFPEYINHSDLLVLDYHLDGQPETDDGSRSRKIIKHLIDNNHFNLIIVHTKGHAGDIQQVYEQILKDVIHLPDLSNIHSEYDEMIEDFLDSSASEEVKQFADLKISFLDIAKSYNLTKDILDHKKPDHILNRFENEIEQIMTGTGVKEKDVVAWKLHSLIGISTVTNHNSKWHYDNDTNFISTGRAFVTVVRKVDEEAVESLYNKLIQALVKNNPPPIMLLLAKIRHELDEKGVEQASDIINDQLAQSGWLFDMYNAESQDDFKHLAAIRRHWEQLSNASKEPLVNFSKRMYSIIKSQQEDKLEAARSFFPETNIDEITHIKHLNAYVCSYPVNGSHLNTGTIFELEEGNVKNFWVCLTPACDLVPSQAKKRWDSRLGDNHSAFQAVCLIPVEINNTSSKKEIQKFKDSINQNEHIFIKYNGEVLVFRFTKGDISNPIWETFYALDHGNFSVGNILRIQHLRPLKVKKIYQDEHGVPAEIDTIELQLSDVKEIKAVASLRYEYGLNLLQKLGGNQSRVGLDFISKLF